MLWCKLPAFWLPLQWTPDFGSNMDVSTTKGECPSWLHCDSSYYPSNVIPKSCGKEELLPNSSLMIKGESNLHVVWHTLKVRGGMDDIFWFIFNEVYCLSTCAHHFEATYKIPVWLASAGCIPSTLLNALPNFPPRCNSLLAFSTVNCWN